MFSVNHLYEGCFLCQFKREEFPVWCKGEEGGKRFPLIPEALDSWKQEKIFKLLISQGSYFVFGSLQLVGFQRWWICPWTPCIIRTTVKTCPHLNLAALKCWGFFLICHFKNKQKNLWDKVNSWILNYSQHFCLWAIVCKWPFKSYYIGQHCSRPKVRVIMLIMSGES